MADNKEKIVQKPNLKEENLEKEVSIKDKEEGKENLDEEQNAYGEESESIQIDQKESKRGESKKKKVSGINPDKQQLLRDILKTPLDHIPDDLRVGYQIKVHTNIKEGNKERVQIFEGLIIKMGSRDHHRTITVRKISQGIGVERVFVISSPNILKIELVRKFKVRRANIGYIRKLKGKASRLKEIT